MTPLIPNKPRRSSDDNLIPLINIVFLLLIFFMVAGQIRASLPALELPDSELGKTAENQPLRIALASDQQLYLNNIPITEIELTRRIQQENAPIQLFADKNLQAQYLDDTLNLLRRAGSDSITLISQTASQ